MAVSSPHLFEAPHLTNLAQPRPRLAIAQGLGTTEIWASAGTGKTTLLAQWAAEVRADGETAAWISIPAAGSSRPRLPALMRGSLAVNSPPASPRGGPANRVNLLFDDVHHLHDPTEAQWLAQLIESRPRDTRIVLAGRHPPNYPAHHPPRFGAGSEEVSVEYRTADLAFTRAETAAFDPGRGH
ncbi:hypothetical protein QNO00_12925 [Arthrobacter sp. zg-Y1219]|uniref:hypothetical protein n=1 Tax=Arthrobacter sp. zg-Y1219 TaxID=3049067 RepID=UPI0024C3DDF6|nr:hypothetical protein [Arthrobacter sp. zg-Y1219]MDK1361163.1 hypothetical protein [Arthrobacter sp. zg-Y1219]